MHDDKTNNSTNKRPKCVCAILAKCGGCSYDCMTKFVWGNNFDSCFVTPQRNIHTRTHTFELSHRNTPHISRLSWKFRLAFNNAHLQPQTHRATATHTAAVAVVSCEHSKIVCWCVRACGSMSCEKRRTSIVHVWVRSRTMINSTSCRSFRCFCIVQ